MKIRRLMAFAAAASVAVSALMSSSVSAVGADSIDFEDGDISFITMKTDDGGDVSVLSVEDFEGSKQLKVDVQDCTLIPKVKIDVGAVLGDSAADVARIAMDITIESKDEAVPPGWFGGAIGTQGTPNPAWAQTDWEGGEYELPVSAATPVERKFLLPSQRFVAGAEDVHIMVMKWAGEVEYNMYIDNIVFYDNDGNAIALGGGAPVAEETPAAEAAPEASDGTSDAPATGNVPAAAMIAVMAAAGAGAAVSRKRSK